LVADWLVILVRLTWNLAGARARATSLPALADDGTIAPDPPRLARAHRAGLRPTSPWLWPASTCLALGLVLHVTGEARVEAWRELWAAGLAGMSASAVWSRGVGELCALLGWSAGLALVVALVTGSLGWVDDRAAEGLAAGSRRSVARGVLAFVVPALAVALVMGVCAGAARAVDASADGLTTLWLAWLRGGLFGTGLLLLIAGLVDRRLAQHRLWRALHQSVAEVREERRNG
jgi:hypothetical protein